VPDRVGVIVNIDGGKLVLFIRSGDVTFWCHRNMVAREAGSFYDLREGQRVIIEEAASSAHGRRCKILGLEP
jgi:hypothetical protein